jgi:hypothetical protein
MYRPSPLVQRWREDWQLVPVSGNFEKHDAIQTKLKESYKKHPGKKKARAAHA